MQSSNDIQAIIVSQANQFPQYAKELLNENPVHANLFLPILQRLTATEANGRETEGQLWVVIHVNHDVKFIASCTRGYTGDYPLFIFTPLPAHLHQPKSMLPFLSRLAEALTSSISTHRIYSVFAAEVVTQTFASIWSQHTGITIEPVPYHHSKISYATAQSMDRMERSIASIPGARCEMRPATPTDIEGVAEMCFKFAESCPPFTLTLEGAYREAQALITEQQVWVYTATFPDGRTGIPSIVAFTRNTDVAAAITKACATCISFDHKFIMCFLEVYTPPDLGLLGCSERLVQSVCKDLLKTRRYVVLYVGLNNNAENTFQHIGFFGIGPNSQPVNGVENYLELGFDHRRVSLGHW